MTNRKRGTNSRNGQGNSPVNDSGMTPQQVMETGQQASQLLQAPVYNLTHRMAMDELIALWSQTRPEEVKTRESLWMEFQSLGKMAIRLASHVDRANELLARQQGAEQTQENDYLDQQGFGEWGEAAPFQ